MQELLAIGEISVFLEQGGCRKSIVRMHYWWKPTSNGTFQLKGGKLETGGSQQQLKRWR